MSADTETDLPNSQVRTAEQSDSVSKRGEDWIERHNKAFKRLPKGTIVAINCRTGEYVLASTRLEIINVYQQRFGKEPGFVHEIGGAVFAGWGGGVV